MTFSIIARDEETGRIGAAVASKFLAVGARNLFVKTGAGVVVTQAIFNPYYGPRGLALLAAGASAADAVRLLTAADEGRHLRQLHLMDRQGRLAAHTGSDCTAWCGHVCKPTFSVAGNTLAGAGVLEAMVASYEAKAELPFARRVIAAMQAGEAAGGDTRGRQSAALLVHDEEDYSLLDLRADDHADPLAEIARLEEIARQSWVHFRRVLPSTGNASGVLDRAEMRATIDASVASGRE
jgi:uncharacterized Ntn-hydrolase superfamily protein